MEALFIVLILVILLNTLFRLTFARWWLVLVYAIVAGAFIATTWQIGTGLSKTGWLEWLYGTRTLQNMSVFITIESLILISFVFVRLQSQLGVEVKKWYAKVSHYYPPLLLFPALFYLLALLFFNLTGVDFALIAYSAIVAAVVLLPLLTLLIKWLLPDEELRLELSFIFNLFVCFIGFISTTSADTVYTPKRLEAPTTPAIIIGLGIFLLLFLVGYGIGRFRRYRKIRP